MQTSNSMPIPPGQYYIGDPTFIFPISTLEGKEQLLTVGSLLDYTKTSINHIKTRVVQYRTSFDSHR